MATASPSVPFGALLKRLRLAAGFTQEALAGAADTVGCQSGWSATALERAALAAARQALGEREAAAAWAEGQALTLEQAVAEALQQE